MVFKEYISYDGHKFTEESVELLMGTYYFLSDNRIDHHIVAMTFISVLSKFGGLSSTISLILGSFAIFINKKLMMGHMI